MKVSDYIFSFLKDKGVKDVFMLSGGGNMHLVDSLGSSGIRYICCHHEQACSMAAEAYAKYTNTLGVALVTTGPGATNAITGCAGAYMDSVPCLFISGQAKRSQTICNSDVPLRQFGAQEVDIVPIVESITKYAVTVNNPEKIRYYLEKAYHLTTTGRPGPVWIDVPLDVQAAEINGELERFIPHYHFINYRTEPTDEDVGYLVEQINQSQRPVLVCGNGVKTAGAKDYLRVFVENTKIPIVTSMVAVDVLYTKHENNIGVIGTKGTRAANFAVQNSDLVISLGCRLSVSTVAYEFNLFAREAKIVCVDIDPMEHLKKTIKVDRIINCDAKEMLKTLIKIKMKPKDDWLKVCDNWKAKYPVCLEEYRNTKNGVNFYNFVDHLTQTLDSSVPIVTDAGSCFFVSQGINIKENQRYITSAALATMGFSLPASVGVGVNSPVAVVTGDGSFQLNIQELQTIKHHNLPVKIFVMNNNGYFSIRNTQNKFFNGRLVGTDSTSGLSFPDLRKIAYAYGLDYYKINDSNGLTNLGSILGNSDPFICEVMINEAPMIPCVSSYIKPDGSMQSRPMEDMYPFLDRDEFKSNMIVPVIE